jgi:hypothetical protein
VSDTYRVIKSGDVLAAQRLANTVSWACGEAGLDPAMASAISQLALEYAQAEGLLMVKQQS